MEMSTLRFITSAALPEFLTSLLRLDNDGRQPRVLVPALQGQAVVFTPYAPGREVTLDKATVSPKAAVLPPEETLLRYRRVKEERDPASVRLELEDLSASAQPVIIVGCRPCDARGFSVLDRPFLQGRFVDPYYARRREQLLVITRTCNTPCATCFCTWTGSHPADTEGSDVLMTAVHDGYLLEAVSTRGEALLLALDLPDGTHRKEEAETMRLAARESMPLPPDLRQAREKLAARFNDAEFWTQAAQACISCGACTYMCPTCYCFNITDEGDGYGDVPGRRLRTWDSCMSAMFTREASGHNPRPDKALRLRNRVLHKFSNYPAVWNGTFSCSGCGRCIAQCPVHIDIRAIVLAGIKE